MELLTANDVAKLLGVTIQTLARWRKEGSGPEWKPLGASKKPRIRYIKASVERWVEQGR